MKELSNNRLITILKERLAQAKSLEQENHMLLKKVDELNQKLLESEAFKSHFISNVTNEIINPFASVSGLSRAIMALQGDELKKAPDMAALIYEESILLDFQLGNIFAAARIESGVIFPEVSTISVGQLIEETVEKFRHAIDKKRLHISVEAPVGEALKKSFYFKTDRDKLKQILLNLLDNAIKFSDSGKQIHITYSLNAGRLEITVGDEGQGIKHDELERIFDRFHRANKNINSLNPGNGLGLSVVEGFLYVMNGKIEVKSKEGKGTKIKIEIPEIQDNTFSEDEDGLFEPDEDDEIF